MSKLNILLIEDNLAIQNVIRFNLLSVGMEVTSVNRGDEGLRVFNKEMFDCLICDHNMPGMTGMELIQAIRQGTHNSDVPIILCTSRILDMDSAYLKNDLRVIAAIGKPFSVRQIVSTVIEATRSKTPTLTV